MSPADSPSTQAELSGSPSSQHGSSKQRVSRRAALAFAGTTAVSTLAGCNVLDTTSKVRPVYEGNWHSYGNGPTNANHIAGGTPKPTNHEVLAPGDWPYTLPVVHENVVYFAAGHEVIAVAIDGSQQWSRRLDTEVSAAPAIDPARGRLYVPTRVVPTIDGPDPAPASVTVLSLNDGAIRGTFRVGNRRTYGVSIFEGDIYVRSATACVRVAPDGTEHWRRSLEPLIYEEYNLGDFTATQIAPAVTANGVYIPDRNALVKLDPETGEERWRVAVDTAYAASVIGANSIVQTGWQETVAVTHAGDVRWRRNLHSRAAAASGRDDDIYVIAGDLYELDSETGETNWQIHIPEEGTAAPVVTDGTVLVAAGGVRAFRRDIDGVFQSGRERWQTSGVHVAAYSSPVIAAGHTFVTGPMGLVALTFGDDD